MIKHPLKQLTYIPYYYFLKIINSFLIFQRLVCVLLLVSSIACKDCALIFAK